MQISHCVTSLSAALDHLHSAKLILKSETNLKVASANSTTPHNTKTSTQRYHSTRRKRQRRLFHALVKPTEEEVKKIKLDLSNTCSSCFQEEPPELESDEESEILWAECCLCLQWFHWLCVGKEEEIDCSKNYICTFCKNSQ